MEMLAWSMIMSKSYCMAAVKLTHTGEVLVRRIMMKSRGVPVSNTRQCFLTFAQTESCLSASIML
jgi:hypothetical protein